ncbi:MAG: hypothetical protein ACRDP7_46260 [Trebonia sp.]
MRIDRSDPLDGPDDAHVNRHAQPVPDDPNAIEKDTGKTVGGDGPPDSSPHRSNSAIWAEQTAAHRALVDAVYRQYDIDHRDAREEIPDDRLIETGREAEAFFLKKGETLQASGGDVPDDPRNHSNPKTGRFDASWSAYDLAIAAARKHTDGDLGPDSIKMYDYNPEIGEGTGTLIGEQTPDRLRGWRIDGQDGHVNWWDWTGGKKGAGGAYGHDWFPEDPSVPGSRYIGWAPWQDNDGNILEGN